MWLVCRFLTLVPFTGVCVSEVVTKKYEQSNYQWETPQKLHVLAAAGYDVTENTRYHYVPHNDMLELKYTT